MQADQLYRNLLFRQTLRNQFNSYSEFETNVLIGIFVMNSQALRCSGNTLIKYLSEIYRMPYRKSLLAAIRKFKNDDRIRATGSGSGTNIRLTAYGKQYLFELEERLSEVRIMD